MSAAPYGHRLGDDRMILVHVVDGLGWRPAPGGGITALAMCGAGLDRGAGWPAHGQKWCRGCTDEQYRHVNETHIWPAGTFGGGGVV